MFLFFSSVSIFSKVMVCTCIHVYFVFSIHALCTKGVSFINSRCFPELKPMLLLSFYQNSDVTEHLEWNSQIHIIYARRDLCSHLLQHPAQSKVNFRVRSDGSWFPPAEFWVFPRMDIPQPILHLVSTLNLLPCEFSLCPPSWSFSFLASCHSCLLSCSCAPLSSHSNQICSWPDWEGCGLRLTSPLIL